MRTYLLAGVLGFALTFAAAGCGDGGDGSAFSSCGNGVLDSGEQCDDGNLDDVDACLSTCQNNVCGDGYEDRTHHECEPGISTCKSVGFNSADNLATCSASCVADTSGCSAGNPTPIPTATPVESGGATPTPTSTPVPTAQPTPVGSVCAGTEQIVVTVALDASVDSATVNLAYGTSVNLPGSGIDPAVKSRVAFTGTGITVINDFDANDDLVDDTLTISLVGSDIVAAGPFATVTFDCIGGQPVPTAGDLACTASASLGSDTITPACSVSIQ